jgi:AcrR family transcriptional regulator
MKTKSVLSSVEVDSGSHRELSRRGRPASVSTTEIVGAAVAVIDESGIDSLTMRALADAMGVAPMTLYRHVADKQALLAMIPDALLVTVCARVQRKRSSVASLQAVADGLADVLVRHRSVASLFNQPQPGPNMQAAADHVVQLLVDEGMGKSEAQAMLRAVVAQVIGEIVTMHRQFDSSGVKLLLEGARNRLDSLKY